MYVLSCESAISAAAPTVRIRGAGSQAPLQRSTSRPAPVHNAASAHGYSSTVATNIGAMLERRCAQRTIVKPALSDYAPGWTRTSNPRLRRPALYPVELQGQADASEYVSETSERRSNRPIVARLEDRSPRPAALDESAPRARRDAT